MTQREVLRRMSVAEIQEWTAEFNLRAQEAEEASLDAEAVARLRYGRWRR